MKLQDKVSFRCGDCANFGGDCDAGDVDGNEDRIACEKFRRRAAPGNVAAMREALLAIDRNTDLLDIADDLAPNLHPSHSFVAVQIRKIARAALSAPARNCDRYGDEDDAFAAWHDALNDGDVVSVRNAFAWLFAKAEGAE